LTVQRACARWLCKPVKLNEVGEALGPLGLLWRGTALGRARGKPRGLRGVRSIHLLLRSQSPRRNPLLA